VLRAPQRGAAQNLAEPFQFWGHHT